MARLSVDAAQQKPAWKVEKGCFRLSEERQHWMDNEFPNNGDIFMKSSLRLAWLAAILLIGSLLSGCIGSTFSRGLFEGYVVGQTQEQVVDKVGKPASDEKSGDAVKWVYKKKTFDPDNMNAVDALTTVVFQPDPVTKKLVAVSVQFS